MPQLSTVATDLASVAAVPSNPLIAWAVGTKGVILKTTSGGR
jgi:hypothetical protein